jgi:hypothetical protein
MMTPLPKVSAFTSRPACGPAFHHLNAHQGRLHLIDNLLNGRRRGSFGGEALAETAV